MQPLSCLTRSATGLLQRPCTSTRHHRHAAAPQPHAAARLQRWQRATEVVPAATASEPSSTEPEEADGLLPEEDQQVPGGYQDSLSSNTELGRAVRGACSELETLEGLERDTLQQAEDLLKQMGFKGSLFAGAPPPPPLEGDDEEEQQA
ncbi:hypothetical protein D9Q98_008424 [Chlorella vulgaris]|uniref:Uncharacterized protein n=1 Tax=Chlorella vulgaris TaxID=3077 RepID=A0A9D4YT24_CHLVU|nr:hypothetical protein D9Q98_008424 [Chlorella vulgaris]